MDIVTITHVLKKHGYEATPAPDSASVSGQKTTATLSQRIVVDAGGSMLWTRSERRDGQAQQTQVNGRMYEVVAHEQRDISVRKQVGASAQPLTFLSPVPTTNSAPTPDVAAALDIFLGDMAVLPVK